MVLDDLFQHFLYESLISTTMPDTKVFHIIILIIMTHNIEYLAFVINLLDLNSFIPLTHNFMIQEWFLFFGT